MTKTARGRYLQLQDVEVRLRELQLGRRQALHDVLAHHARQAVLRHRQPLRHALFGLLCMRIHCFCILAKSIELSLSRFEIVKSNQATTSSCAVASAEGRRHGCSSLSHYQQLCYALFYVPSMCMLFLLAEAR